MSKDEWWENLMWATTARLVQMSEDVCDAAALCFAMGHEDAAVDIAAIGQWYAAHGMQIYWYLTGEDPVAVVERWDERTLESMPVAGNA